MNRVLKILSIAVVLFLAYMWISILYKSCNENKEFDDFAEEMVDVSDEVPTIEDDFMDGDDFEMPDSEVVSEDEIKEDPIDYSELDEKIENEQNQINNREEEVVSNVKSTPSSVGNGKYMVIAGSYIKETNADQMVNRLSKLGYQEAEKVVFDLSQFHSVCAGRYNDYTKAIQVSSDLKKRGIDNYVHRRK